MQTLQISDEAAHQLYELAATEHASASEIMERLIKARADETRRKRHLQAFFQPYRKEMTGFYFDREEANAR